jgi:hypothetical protein
MRLNGAYTAILAGAALNFVDVPGRATFQEPYLRLE